MHSVLCFHAAGTASGQGGSAAVRSHGRNEGRSRPATRQLSWSPTTLAGELAKAGMVSRKSFCFEAIEKRGELSEVGDADMLVCLHLCGCLSHDAHTCGCLSQCHQRPGCELVCTCSGVPTLLHTHLSLCCGVPTFLHTFLRVVGCPLFCTPTCCGVPTFRHTHLSSCCGVPTFLDGGQW